jgi:hypothetical protein
MSDATNQPVSPENTDDEPIYYNPSRLSMISGIASVVSWIVFAYFIIDTILQGIGIQSQISKQGLAFSTLVSDPNFLAYLFSNILRPLFTGIAFFLLLQAAAIGLNVVLELDFNMREAKGNK